MAAQEGFDISSDEENFENDWKFDENDNISASVDANTATLNVDTNKDVANFGKYIKLVAENSSERQKVSRMDLNTAKAGMEGLDKDKINHIIHEASKGSRFYENEKKKEKQVQKRIEELQTKMASFYDEQKAKARQIANKTVQELEQARDLSRTIVHIDMDAFYAAVEMRDDPSLKSKPMAVGGSAMLCTSNYLARRYGVRAGMPGFIAKKLCPNLTIVPTNFDKYTKISHEIREVLAEYDRNFLPMSLDEAYLDITGYLRTIGDGKQQQREGVIVKIEEAGEMEGKHEIQKHDTGEFASMCIRESAPARSNEYVTREWVNNELVEVKQETDDPEAISDQDFEQVVKPVNGERTVDAIIHEANETNCARIRGVDVVEDEALPSDRDLESIPDLNIELVAKQLKVDTVEGKASLELVNQTKDEGIGQTIDAEVDKIKRQDPDTSLGENESDTDEVHKERATTDRGVFYNTVEEVVKELRRKIEEKTQLTASAGIAPNMFLAKVCSDKNKPNGQFYLKPERDKIMEFVRELPLRKAFGIGRVSEQILTSVLKVNTCSELYDRRDLMQLLFTPVACRNYLEISLGLGSTVVDVDRERKSMSTETTFKEINKPEEHFAKCRELCQELSDSLKAHGLTARKIGIKLKTVNFEVKTRVTTASFPVQKADELFSHAKKLLVNEIRTCSPEPLRLRLMGVRAAEFPEKGMDNESKQPTILSLVKKGGNAGSTNLNTSQAAGSRNAHVTKQEEVSLEHASTSGVAALQNSEFCSDSMLNDHPSTSKENTIDGLSSETVKMERPSPVKQDVSREEPTTFSCPVCGKNLTFTTCNALLQMNQHVDMCLRKQAIPGVLKYDSGQQSSKAKQTSKKRKRESSSNPNKTVKRKPMDRFLTKHTK